MFLNLAHQLVNLGQRSLGRLLGDCKMRCSKKDEEGCWADGVTDGQARNWSIVMPR